jgi:hypothetical protein
MKHKHAEFIKAWADDITSVQCRLKNGNGDWTRTPPHAFDWPDAEFRMTPTPLYWYLCVYVHGTISRIDSFIPVRMPSSNIRLTYIDGKLTDAEVITNGDGK